MLPSISITRFANTLSSRQGQNGTCTMHSPTEVIMDRRVEIIWDMIISTDRAVGANRPDIIIRDKQERKTYIIDISCPSDVNVVAKENEKITKYGALRVELGKMWDCECEVVPVVVGGLGPSRRILTHT